MSPEPGPRVCILPPSPRGARPEPGPAMTLAEELLLDERERAVRRYVASRLRAALESASPFGPLRALLADLDGERDTEPEVPRG